MQGRNVVALFILQGRRNAVAHFILNGRKP